MMLCGRRIPYVRHMNHFNNKRFYCEVTPPNQGKVEPVVKTSFINGAHPKITKLESTPQTSAIAKIPFNQYSDSQKDLSLFKKLYTNQNLTCHDIYSLYYKFTFLGCLIGCFYGYCEAKKEVSPYYTYSYRCEIYSKTMAKYGFIGGVIGFLWNGTIPILIVVIPVNLISIISAR
jgi:hypothetical protein